MKRRFVLLSALTALLSMFVIVSPAHATTQVGSDPNDTWLSRVDILNVGASYDSNLASVAMWAESPIDPDYWPSGQTAIWGIDTDRNGAEDYYVGLVTGFAAVFRSSDDVKTCDADYTYDGSLFLVAFSPSCIGTPAGFQVLDPWMHDDTYDVSDFGPDCCTVTLDAAPTTTTPPPTPTTTTTAPAPADPPVSSAGVHDGYWMLTKSGSIYGFGSAQAATVASPVSFTRIEPTPTGNGYWVLSEGGGVIAKGDAVTLPAVGVNPGERAVSLSSTPSGKGYWIFTDRGRVVARGDAPFFGDLAGTPLNGAVLGSVATPTGKGYWMVASDGGIFSFGDAVFHGSTGGMKLNKPVMAMAPAQDGSGYWLVASDGGIFAFDVPFYGSMGSTPLNKPISGMVPGVGGYMMVAQDGGVFSFGSVAFHGSLGANPPSSPVISVALQP